MEEYNVEETFTEILTYSTDEAYKYCEEEYEKTKNPEFLIYKGHTHLIFGEYEEAIECVDIAFEKGCTYYVYGYNVKGEALLELGLYVESRRCFEKVLEEEDSQYLATSFLIELDIRECLFIDAINKCIDYIEKYGDNLSQVGDLKSIIGWTYLLDLKDGGIAEEAFKEAIIDNPNCARAYTGLGIYYSSDKRYEKAMEYFQRAIRIDGEDGENYFGLSLCYRELEQFDEVENLLMQANVLQPEDERILIAFGFEMLRQEREEHAVDFFKKVVEINPEYEDIRNLIDSIEN